MSRQLTRHQPVLVSQNQSHSNDIAPAIKRGWLVVRRAHPAAILLIVMMLAVVSTNLAVIGSGSKQMVTAAPQTEQVQLAQIDASARIAIARSHYDAEIASHNRRAIFGAIILGIIFLALVGAFMQIKGSP